MKHKKHKKHNKPNIIKSISREELEQLVEKIFIDNKTSSHNLEKLKKIADQTKDIDAYEIYSALLMELSVNSPLKEKEWVSNTIKKIADKTKSLIIYSIYTLSLQEVAVLKDPIDRINVMKKLKDDAKRINIESIWQSYACSVGRIINDLDETQKTIYLEELESLRPKVGDQCLKDIYDKVININNITDNSNMALVL